jgi:hypothetical protein
VLKNLHLNTTSIFFKKKRNKFIFESIIFSKLNTLQYRKTFAWAAEFVLTDTRAPKADGFHEDVSALSWKLMVGTFPIKH